MAALDFKEIPPAHTGLERDQFETFAREFLHSEGFKVVENPDRGVDDGSDLIVEEDRTGPGGTNKVRWLVSCKHKAHSGDSVRAADEINVRDRIENHECLGFISFYSTLPSSGLSTTLKALSPRFEYLQLDNGIIERKLLENPRGRTLAARYMPISFQRWIMASQTAVSTSSSDPQRSATRFFLRVPHDNIRDVKAEAQERGVLVFLVIFDPDHPTHSKIEHGLGYFMEYHTTKKLVDQHFAIAVVPSTSDNALELIPEDDPLEKCLWIVMRADGSILRCESVVGNPDVGMRVVRSVVKDFG